MSHSQFHCNARVYLDMHGLIFETSICYWQDQPGSRAAGRPAPRSGCGSRLGALRAPEGGPDPTPGAGGERAGRGTAGKERRPRLGGAQPPEGGAHRRARSLARRPEKRASGSRPGRRRRRGSGRPERLSAVPRAGTPCVRAPGRGNAGSAEPVRSRRSPGRRRLGPGQGWGALVRGGGGATPPEAPTRRPDRGGPSPKRPQRPDRSWVAT